MLQNNNLKICRKLARREFQFHRGQSVLLILAITLVCMLYTFSFSLGSLTYDGFIDSYKTMYGSDSHIICYDLTDAQAKALADHAAVKDAAVLSPVGMLSDEMLENRNVRLAEVSGKWAKATGSVPLYGGFPTEKNEIALDEVTLNSLLIPHEIGAVVSLKWRPQEGGEERTSTFRLCGWWKNAMGETDSCAWITREAARELGADDAPGHKLAGLMLYLPGDLERQAEKIFSDLGMRDIPHTTNLVYNRARQAYAGGMAMKFYRMNLIVILCGMLMLYHIFRLLARQNIRFYGRVKSLGMTPRQIRALAVARAAGFFLSGLLPGWIFGFSLCAAFAPYVVVGMEENPALYFFRVWPFPASALFTGMTVLAACLLPLRYVRKKTPAEVMRCMAADPPAKRAGRKMGKPPVKVLRRMALTGLSRQKGQSVLTALSLLLSLIVLCCVWTKYVSYDEEKYLQEMALCDYLLSDATASSGIQRYNPASRSITPEIVKELAAHPAVTDFGTVSTMEVPMYATSGERAPIVDTFEEVDESGTVRKKYMEDEPDFLAGYEKMRESGEYIGIVTGVDDLTLRNALARNVFLDGEFSREAFGTGKYVIAAGASSSTLRTTPPAGSKVTICGRDFEIMASVPGETSLFTGADSRQAQFHITYYVPAEIFGELFPGHGIRNVAVNIDRTGQQEFEKFLETLLEDTGISVTSIGDYQWYFRDALFHQCVIPLFVGSVMLFIGILNFANTLMTGILVRKKEFAVYESLGMTKRQLRKMLLTEGLAGYTAILLLLLPATSAATWLWGRWWLAHTDTWCVTWRFSLTPLWISLSLLLVPAIAVPLHFLKVVTRESVTERLRVIE